MRQQNDQKVSKLSLDQAEDLFAARLARILVDQVLDARNNCSADVISTKGTSEETANKDKILQKTV